MFKDKPLKKINADTRVTIDVIHQDITKGFKNKRDDFLKDKKDIDEYNFKDEVDYYLETGEILSEYYSKRENTEIKKKKLVSLIL